MKGLYSIKDKFEYIEQSLHMASNYIAVLDSVKAIFREAQYAKRYHIITIGGLFRSTQNTEDTWFDNSRKLNYPPANLLTMYGRCNCPHEPVFYCSDENVVPMYEIRPNLNSYVVVSKWKNRLHDKITFRCLLVGAQLSTNQLEDTNPLKKMLLQDDYYRNDTSKAIKDIDDCIGNLFARSHDSNDRFYWLTSAITWCLMNLTEPNSSQKIDGLIYPSVASNLDGINVILTPNYVDQHLTTVEAAMYKVVCSEVDKYQFKLIKLYKQAQKESSILNWQLINTNKIFNISDKGSYELYIYD